VRELGHQLLPAGQQRLELLCHRIEVSGQGPDFVAAPGIVDRRGMVTLRQRGHPAGNRVDRPQDVSGLGQEHSSTQLPVVTGGNQNLDAESSESWGFGMVWRPRFLPHYLADYELSVRIRRQGWRLLVARDGVVYSKNEFGNSARPASLWRRLLSRRSPDYLPALLLFWWGASNWPQRLTLPLRLPILALLPGLRRAPK